MSVMALPATSASFTRRASGAPALRLRITRRGRAVLGVLFAAGVAAAVSMGAMGAVGMSSAAASRTSGDVQFDVHTVLAGETLWSIAGELDPTADPREIIAELQHFNGLVDSTIMPGQQLAIPPQLAD